MSVLLYCIPINYLYICEYCLILVWVLCPNIYDVTHNTGVTLRCASKRRFSQETKGFTR